MISPAAARRARRSRSSSRACASRRSAGPTCARSSPPTASGAQRLGELAARLGAERLREAHRRGARLLRAAHARLPGGAARRRARAPRTCSRRPRATCGCACARSVARRAAACSTSAGSAAQHAGNLNCPLAVTRSACLFARAGADRPRHPAHRGRLPPDRGARARRAALLNARPGAAVAAGNVETSSRVADLVLSAFGRAQGQGTMNNLTLGDDALLLLRDARRRPGRVRRRGRPERRARRDEQHAQHARSRRSSANSRCACSSTRCAAARAAPGATAAATASCASSRRSREMTFSLIAERRRHAPAGRRRRRAPGARARPARRRAARRARRRARCAPGQRLRIETPGGGGFGRCRSD